VCRRVVASFAGHRRSTLSSFPRRRESTPQALWSVRFYGLDSRLRGNDRWFVREVIPNDATTCRRCVALWRVYVRRTRMESPERR